MLLSAWFYDAGFAVTKNGAREKSIEIARDFLSRHGQPESLADAVATCIEGVAAPQDGPDGLASAVLHDALLAPLGSKSYLSQAELLRLEEEQRSEKVHSDLEWTQDRIDSLVVGLVLRKIEEHRNLIVPTIVLLCVNVAVVVMSIYSMRAGRELRHAAGEMAAHDANLLLTTSNVKVSLADYLERMNGLISDAAYLQKTLFEYLYFLRNLIIHRKKTLQLTYDVFIYGLAVFLVLFIVAIVWF